MKWLKWILEEFKKDSFYYKFLLPIIGLFLTWGFISQFYLTTLSKTNLESIKGSILKIGIQKVESNSSLYKTTTYNPLIITINNSNDEFRLRHQLVDYFGKIQRDLKIGDTITIYKKFSLQAMFTMGRKNDIFQIEKDKKIIFEIKELHPFLRSQWIAFLIFDIIILIALFYYIIVKKTINESN